MLDGTSTAAAVSDATRSAPQPLRMEFAPELLLPSQLPAGVRLDASIHPERRLMLAVLEEAVADFQRHVMAGTRERMRLFHEAHAWVTADEPAWPFSFVNICQALALDCDALRAGLLRWGERQRERTRLGDPLVRIQLRRVAGFRSRATGRTARGRTRSRW
jgi:hypothetical protein